VGPSATEQGAGGGESKGKILESAASVDPRLHTVVLYPRQRAGRPTETPEETVNKLREIFEIVRRNLDRASQDQAGHYNLRRRQCTPTVGDVVWGKEHHLSKADEGFAAKLGPRYDGPY